MPPRIRVADPGGGSWYLERLTASEMCTVLTAGMATVASNVLALYVLTLQNQFPTIAGHLVSASLLSAPAALILSESVPWGTISSSTSPARICFSAAVGREAEVEKGNEAMTFFTCLFSNSTR